MTTRDVVTEITIERRGINPELLHEELSMALGTKLAGVSYNGSSVRVHMLGPTTDEEDMVVKDIVARHDATRLTDTQQAELARRIALNALRSKPWADWTAADKDMLLRFLAERLLSSIP